MDSPACCYCICCCCCCQVVAMKEEIKTYLTSKGVDWEEVN
jgi:hypothetical protein